MPVVAASYTAVAVAAVVPAAAAATSAFAPAASAAVAAAVELVAGPVQPQQLVMLSRQLWAVERVTLSRLIRSLGSLEARWVLM